MAQATMMMLQLGWLHKAHSCSCVEARAHSSCIEVSVVLAAMADLHSCWKLRGLTQGYDGGWQHHGAVGAVWR